MVSFSDCWGCPSFTQKLPGLHRASLFAWFNPLLLSALLFCLVLLLPVAAVQASHDNSPIRFGSVAMETPPMMHQRLLPLTRYLSEALARPVTLFLAPNMATAIDDVATGTVELSYLTPVAYVRAHERSNSRLIAKALANGHGATRLVIVVKRDGPIQGIADLAGKRFAFGDREALLQRAVVTAAGMPLERLGHYEFLDHYDNITRSVLHGAHDAGILREATAMRWLDKGLRIIHHSAELPTSVITASHAVNDKLLWQLRDAFLRLDASNPEHYAVIKALDSSYTGFAAASDREYERARKMIAPFMREQRAD